MYYTLLIVRNSLEHHRNVAFFLKSYFFRIAVKTGVDIGTGTPPVFFVPLKTSSYQKSENILTSNTREASLKNNTRVFRKIDM